jgi:hypothetical protein
MIDGFNDKLCRLSAVRSLAGHEFEVTGTSQHGAGVHAAMTVQGHFLSSPPRPGCVHARAFVTVYMLTGINAHGQD